MGDEGQAAGERQGDGSAGARPRSGRGARPARARARRGRRAPPARRRRRPWRARRGARARSVRRVVATAGRAACMQAEDGQRRSGRRPEQERQRARGASARASRAASTSARASVEGWNATARASGKPGACGEAAVVVGIGSCEQPERDRHGAGGRGLAREGLCRGGERRAEHEREAGPAPLACAVTAAHGGEERRPRRRGERGREQLADDRPAGRVELEHASGERQRAAQDPAGDARRVGLPDRPPVREQQHQGDDEDDERRRGAGAGDRRPGAAAQLGVLCADTHQDLARRRW